MPAAMNVLRYGMMRSAGAGAGSGAGRRTRARTAAHPAQGQYRLRSEAAFHRCGRHAGRRHRGGLNAVRQAGGYGDRLCSPCRYPRGGRSDWRAICKRRPAACCRPSNSSRASPLELVLRAYSAAPAIRCSALALVCVDGSDRAAAVPRWKAGVRSRAGRGHRRWSGQRRCDRGKRSPGAALWQLRESISEAQKSEGRLDQARYLRAGRGDSGFHRQSHRPPSRRNCQAARPVPSAISATAICISIFSAPPGGDWLRSSPIGTRCARVVHDMVSEFGGSISAEHGIGVMKRDLTQALQEPRRRSIHARPQAHASIRRTFSIRESWCRD